MRTLIHAARTVFIALVALASLPAAPAAAADCVAHPDLCGAPVQSTVTQPDLAVAIDIVFVGDGFTDMAAWQDTANTLIAAFQAHPAQLFDRVPQVFNFHVVDVVSQTEDCDDADTSDTALGLAIQREGLGDAEVTGAPDALARIETAAQNAPDVDVTIVVANSTRSASLVLEPDAMPRGGLLVVALGSGNGSAEATVTQGAAAAIFDLKDESVAVAVSCTADEYNLVDWPNLTTDPTCAKFARISGAGCVQGGYGCGTGLFRSAQSCLMGDPGAGLCPACAHQVDAVLLERRTGRDVAAPWVAGYLRDDAEHVDGHLTIAAGAYDLGRSPVTVDFEVDGAHAATRSAQAGEPALFVLDTTELADGAHTVMMYATDAAGHSQAGLPMTIHVENGLRDTVAPAIEMNPEDGATWVSEDGISLAIARVTNGTEDLTMVSLETSGVIVDTRIGDGVAANSIWPSHFLPGTHTFRGVARDRSGHETQVVSVATFEGFSDADLSAAVEAPLDGSEVGPLFRVYPNDLGNASPFTRYDVLIDGAVVAELTNAAGNRFDGVIDLRGHAPGDYTLQVRQVEPRLGGDTATSLSPPVTVTRVAASEPKAFLGPRPAGYSRWTWEPVSILEGAALFEVHGHGTDSDPLVELALLADGVEVGSTTEAPGFIVWDMGHLHGACFDLQVEARTAGGAAARTPGQAVCVDNLPPVAAVAAPEDGAIVAESPARFLVTVEDESWVDIEIEVNGRHASEMYGGRSQGVIPVAVELDMGDNDVVVRVMDAETGRVATEIALNVTRVAAIPCPGDCDDGDTCTADSCDRVRGECVHEVTCCSGDQDCDDGDTCTADRCEGGVCLHEAATDGSCCAGDYACEDGDVCTPDVCSPEGVCETTGSTCCEADADCEDGDATTVGQCVAGGGGAHCVFVPACTPGEACEDGDVCTEGDVCGQDGLCHAGENTCDGGDDDGGLGGLGGLLDLGGLLGGLFGR